jgi:hypothetical protein
MTIKNLEDRIKALEETSKLQSAAVRTLNDIEEINRLQRSYGYYIQHWMYKELSDLFADSPEAELKIMTGVFSGKESVKKYFYSLKSQFENPDFLHQLMQLSGIVDVMPDGKTAQGRWFALGSVALPHKEGVQAISCNGIYTVEYVKENGIWKILKLTWSPLIMVNPSESWVKKEKAQYSGKLIYADEKAKPDKPRIDEPRYPAGYIVPFHFKHPVTGKKTDVEKHNAAIKQK